jgi:hypothetical protein
MVTIDSPKNNQIYPNSIWLTFAPTSYSGYNFTSFSYSLDGQPPKPTDGHTLLTDLAGGSHSIEIFGSGTSTLNSDQKVDIFLDIVYFSVGYSTQWVVFTVVLAAVVVPSLLAVYVNRAALARRLRAKKKPSFWLGAVSAAVGLILFIPWVNTILQSYLFPRYYFNGETFDLYFVPCLSMSIFFTLTGLALMIYGAHQPKVDRNL